MPILSRLRRVWMAARHRRQLERDITEEVRAYVEERTERGIASGLDAAEARRRAVAECGGIVSMSGRLRDARPSFSLVARVDAVWRDARDAARRLARHPRFSIPCILLLGFGMAIAIVAFSAVNAFMFRPAPVKDGAALMSVAVSRPASGSLRNLSYPNYVDVAAGNTVFRGLAAYAVIAPRLTAASVSVPTWGDAVTANYFDLFGIRPFLGRMLTPDDDAGRDGSVAVVGYDLWQRRLAPGGVRVGGLVRMNGRPFTVVGVAAEGFRGTDPLVAADVWIPMKQAADAGFVGLADRSGRSFRVQGFLAPGVTRPAAAANLDALGATLRARYPVDNHDLQMRVIPERETRPIIDAAAVVAPAATFIMAVALVGLAIDGASVTSLFLARSLTRQREIAIRLAMGASTGRLFRQLLFESLIVASLGACVGFLVASWLLSAFSSWTLPGSMMVDVRPDRTVAFFAIVLAVVTGVATGTWPARRAARADYQQALRDGANSTPARAEGRARSRLVVSQFSALTVLLMLLAVFAGAARTQARVDLGFDPAQRLLLTLSPEELGYDMPRSRSVVQSFLDRVGHLPGVSSAAAAYEPPFDWGSSSMQLGPAEAVPGVVPDRMACTVVTPNYFETIGTPILRGRSFDDGDRAGSPPVVVINDTLARMWWPAGDALGQTIVAPAEASGGRTFEVVGIARTGKYGAANEAPAAFVWFPYAQAYRPSMTVIAHVSGGNTEVVAGARQALKEIDPAVSLANVTTFDALVRERSDNGIRAAALFIAALSLAGFLRAAFGMYGLLSYFAHVQVREIGIRMAFGASRAAIIRMAMRRGVTLAIRGVATGLVVAFIGVRVLGRLLPNASVTPSAWAIVPLLLGAVTLGAAYLPIRRVLAEGPLAALRRD